VLGVFNKHSCNDDVSRVSLFFISLWFSALVEKEMGKVSLKEEKRKQWREERKKNPRVTRGE